MGTGRDVLCRSGMSVAALELKRLFCRLDLALLMCLSNAHKRVAFVTEPVAFLQRVVGALVHC